jgi:dTDP-4-amino-4,6-dideoxygalactose transaminase
VGVQAGDEVIVPPYTFVATINAVLAMHALPVFVDTDPRTFQIDAKKIEAAISPRTVAIVPVHLGGNVADLDAVTAVAAKHRVPVLEDACQAHLAEWKGKKVGTFGTFGCYSFQASKNLNSGEGGAVLTNDSAMIERCYAFHNNGRGRSTPGYDFSYRDRGLNLRLTEFQGALLMAQMTRLAKQTDTREKNAAYLTKQLKEIPGIAPAEQYGGCTRNAYHLYMFRYDAAKFAGLQRAQFLKAMQAEGIPASGGYSPLNKEPLLDTALSSRGFKRAFDEKTLQQWRERNHCPANDRLCAEAVWLTQTMLLGHARTWIPSPRRFGKFRRTPRRLLARDSELCCVGCFNGDAGRRRSADSRRGSGALPCRSTAHETDAGLCSRRVRVCAGRQGTVRVLQLRCESEGSKSEAGSLALSDVLGR